MKRESRNNKLYRAIDVHTPVLGGNGDFAPIFNFVIFAPTFSNWRETLPLFREEHLTVLKLL
jgi:hypothetical protein